jgi:hypothetical protein
MLWVLQAAYHTLQTASVLEQRCVFRNRHVAQKQCEKRLKSQERLTGEETERLVNLEKSNGRGGQPPAIQPASKVFDQLVLTIGLQLYPHPLSFFLPRDTSATWSTVEIGSET